MALILGCSKLTVERRLGAYNLSTRSYSTLTFAELDNHVKDICNIFLRCGERARESMDRVDPSGVQARMRRVLAGEATMLSLHTVRAPRRTPQAH